MKINILKITTFILCLSVLFSLTSCNKSTIKKYVGSRDTEGFSADMIQYKTVEELKNDSELIVTGYYNKKPETVEENFNGEILYASKYEFNINETIKGEIKEKVIYVMQTGKPDSDNFETKIKKDSNYILFLNSKDLQGVKVYDCAGAEQGIFEIKSNNKLLSYVDFGISTKYEDEHKDKLITEIKK